MHTKKICFLLIAVWVLIAQYAQAQCTGTPPVVEIDPPAEISCQNPVVQLNANITPPTGDYSFSWSGPVSNPSIPNPTASQPGVYALFVFDSTTGCWGGDTIVVVQDGTFPLASIDVSSNNCSGPITLTTVVDGGPSSYTYSWITGETTESIQVQPPPAGTTMTYCVTVTDSQSGCTAAACTVVAFGAPLTTEIFYFGSQFCNDSLGMWVTTQGGTPPYAYAWSNGFTGTFIPDPVAGTYIVTVTDANGCTAENFYVVEDNPGECGQLEGYVYADWNTNCVADMTDDGLTQISIKITNSAGDEFFAYTDPSGYYHVTLYPGDYDVTVLTPNNLWDPCQATFSVTLNPDQTLTQDFLLQPLAVCPAMSVDIASTFLRRCFSGQYWVQYCNQGTEDATNASVEILLDPFLSITSAQLPYTDLGNNLYSFDLGTVQFNTCGSFWVKVHVSCDATLGQTHCTEAVIYPTGTCEPVNPQWSGASIQVGVTCETDSLDFIIENIGTGSMSAPLEYVVIEDAVMLMQAPPPSIFLTPGAQHHVKVPANGSTWRVEVVQEEFHPGNSQPSAWAEGCTTSPQFSTGFVNQFPADDNDPWVDIDCTENVGSYDPNDKQGIPKGYDAEHFVEPGTDLEYTIRFQNTGTDTAFTVVIRDQLSPWLDPGSIKPGASSHPYTFEYYGDRDIKFTFDNILLPDSSTNLDGSQGFVSYRISQKDNVPLKTDILNSADIYFDFNVPVTTNTTQHRVDREFVTVSSWQPVLQGLELRVMPNPVVQQAVFELRSETNLTEWQFEMRDVTGRTVRTANVNGTQWQFNRNGLPAGMYLIQVRSGNALIGAGKILLK